MGEFRTGLRGWLRSRDHRRYGRFGLAAATLAGGLLAASTASGSAATAHTAALHHSGTLNVVGTFNFPTLDPGSPKVSIGAAGPILYDVFDGLFQAGPTGNPLPDLATSYSVGRSGEVVVLNLRHGVKFQDGTAFNAQAVAWNLRMYQNPSTGCLCAGFLSTVTSITAPNPYKVVIYLSAPYAPLISALTNTDAALMRSPTAYNSDGETQFGLIPVGAGPYKVTADSPNVSVTLTRSTNYWLKGAPYFNTVNFTVVTTTTSMYATMESGGASVMVGADPTTLSQAKSSSCCKILTAPATTFSAFQMNINSAPFNNPLARQAVFYAINAEAINKSIFANLYNVQQSLFGKGTTTPVLTTPGFDSYDPSKASALVKQLGGLSFSFSPITNSNTEVLLADALQQEFSAVGMTVTVNVQQETAVVQRLLSGNFQAIVTGYGGYSDDGILASLFFYSTGELNHAESNPALDSLINEAAATFDLAKRQALYEKVATLVNDNYYYYPLYIAPGYDIVAKNIQGIPKAPVLYLQDAYAS